MNYYIQGCAANAEQIRVAFEKLGYDTSFVQKLSASDSHILFTLPCDTRVHAFHTAYIEADILKRLVNIDPDFKELELPKPHFNIKNFKPFDKVLARDTENEKWVASLFSNFEYGAFPHKFVCIDTCYTQCIPFEGNEHLLGTTDPCDEQYINW